MAVSVEKVGAMAVSKNGVADSDSPVVDVAQAAELTGLSKGAIRGRLRRGTLASNVHEGRHTIPLTELRRHGLLVEGERYRSLLERAEALEGELRIALESLEQARKELRETQETLRMVWSMVRQKEQELSYLETARERRGSIRWPWRRWRWRRSAWRRGASPAADSG
jgi:chromosome segregation ATPase